MSHTTRIAAAVVLLLTGVVSAAAQPATYVSNQGDKTVEVIDPASPVTGDPYRRDRNG